MTPNEQVTYAVNVFGLCMNLQEAIIPGRITPDKFKRSVKIDTDGNGVTIHNNYT